MSSQPYNCMLYDKGVCHFLLLLSLSEFFILLIIIFFPLFIIHIELNFYIRELCHNSIKMNLFFVRADIDRVFCKLKENNRSIIYESFSVISLILRYPILNINK